MELIVGLWSVETLAGGPEEVVVALVHWTKGNMTTEYDLVRCVWPHSYTNSQMSIMLLLPFCISTCGHCGNFLNW